MEQTYVIENCKSFNARDIFECGQCFRWNKNDNDSYTGVIKNGVLNVKINGENIIFKGILNDLSGYREGTMPTSLVKAE